VALRLTAARSPELSLIGKIYINILNPDLRTGVLRTSLQKTSEPRLPEQKERPFPKGQVTPCDPRYVFIMLHRGKVRNIRYLKNQITSILATDKPVISAIKLESKPLAFIAMAAFSKVRNFYHGEQTVKHISTQLLRLLVVLVGVAQGIEELVVQCFAFAYAFFEAGQKHKNHVQIIKAVLRVSLVGK
jgi:hypothetical protein